MNNANKKDKVFYYIGWGIAYGTFAGGMFSILLHEHLLVVLFMCIALGAVIGAIFGKNRKNDFER